jgi:hypothetical protein
MLQHRIYCKNYKCKRARNFGLGSQRPKKMAGIFILISRQIFGRWLPRPKFFRSTMIMIGLIKY